MKHRELARKALLVLGMVVLTGTLSGCHQVFCGFVEGLTGVPIDCSHDDFPGLPDIPFPSLPPPPSLPTTTTIPRSTTTVPPTTTTTTTTPDGTTTTVEPDGTTTTTSPPVTDPTTTRPGAAARALTHSAGDVRASLREQAEDRAGFGPTTGTTRLERGRLRR